MVTTPKPPIISIALISSATLMYEILLMRLFSIIQWHHFAYMIISLGLLGFGVSGTFVALFQQFLLRSYTSVYLTLIVLFGLSSFLVFQIVQNIPFNALEILWDVRQGYYLLAIFMLLTLPFFFSGSAICITLRRYGSALSKIYGIDLVGAGLGSLGVIALLYLLMPQQILISVSCLILVTAAVAMWELSGRVFHKFALLPSLFIFALLWLGQYTYLDISPYKGLEQSLRIKNAHIILERSSPLGLISVVKSPTVPLRHVPGMSLNSRQEPLDQLGVFTDGDSLSVITKQAEHENQLAYLDQLSSALPYHLIKPERVLILGAGAGSEVLQAQFHDAVSIDAVEINPQIPDLIRNDFPSFSGSLFDNISTRLHITDIRDFIQTTENKYDIIQLSLTDGFSGSAAGVYALNESYVYTVDAFTRYLDVLSPGGILAITRWIKMPPRDSFKILATAVHSLRSSGVADPAKSLVLIRSWQTSTLLVKNGVFNNTELKAVQQFCRDRSFDTAFSWATKVSQVNRYNKLNRPLFYQAAQALTGSQAEEFLHNYKFSIQPATDDQPYFHHFFKWSSLGEILRLRQQGSAALLESSYLVLLATFIIACVVSIALIVAPLWTMRRRSNHRMVDIKLLRVFSYFFAIGTAFFFIEIGFIQKFTRFLHHPVFSITTSLATFLVFAGIGSTISALVQSPQSKRAVILSVAAIGVLSFGYVYSLDEIFSQLGTQSMVLRIFCSVVLIAPLAICMGFPFPLALRELTGHAESYLPWAWGINGCASVISATLATILAIHLGFSALILLAVLLYIVAAWLFLISW